jgi:hypothetical protein
VREQSATYDGPGVRNIGLAVDHFGLNKFGSRDHSYQVILSKLVEFITPPYQPNARTENGMTNASKGQYVLRGLAVLIVQ